MASSCLPKDQLLCSICLEVFADPVTIPCGHNFCKSCITENWNINVCCQCPLCIKVFHSRPELNVNTCISEMAAHLKQSALKEGRRSEERRAEQEEVSCDVCTETKMKAVKSCLACLTSYCETHLEPHHRVPGLKRHQLIEPVENLEGRMCQEHDRLLELFCKTDRMCVCQFCKQANHKGHLIIPLKEEYEQKKAELGAREGKIHQMIREREVKIKELTDLVKRSKEAAEREKTASTQIFNNLIQCIKRSLDQLIDVIEGTAESQAEDFIKQLEEEVSELRKNIAELEQLSHTEDHLQFLQTFPSLNPVPPTKDWTKVKVHSLYEGTVKRAVKRAVAQLEETLGKEMKKLRNNAALKRVQQYAVDVTLDPETAHPNLVLSDDGKHVSSCKERQNFPEKPKRCTFHPNVLGKQGFSSGRFYYEVEVSEKTQWDLGVAKASINRKEEKPLCPRNGYWTVRLRNGNQYKAVVGPSIRLSLKAQPQKVGVFVDYEEGVVCFYDVDEAARIYSFTGCDFTEKLHPLFSPGLDEGGADSAPLVISPVLGKH